MNILEARSAKWVALALFLLTLITRIPFASQTLYHWDSVNMAIGMQAYNVVEGAPQYPGYIVYIALAQIVDMVFHNPQTTMVVISVVSSGLSVVAMFYLGRSMFSPITGLIAALFLLTSPLFWFYGEIALPHALDLFAITFSAWMLYRIMEGDTRWLWPTIVFLGLLGGFRQQDLMFLGPLILFTCYRIGIVRLGLAAVLGAIITLAWLIPTLAYSGGLQSYMAGSAAFTESFWRTTSIFLGAGTFGLRRNIIEKLIPYTLYGWSLALLPALYGFARLPADGRRWLRSRKTWFFILWLIPVLLFYALIHMGQQGLVFVFLPALFVLSAEGLRRLFASRPVLLRAATAIIVLAGAVVFIFVPTQPLGAGRGPKLLTYDTLRQQDARMSNEIATVRANFQPENTVILAANWRHAQFYLPDYRLFRYTLGAKFEVTEGQPTNVDFINQPVSAADLGFSGDQEWNVVLLDPELESFASSDLTAVSGANGFEMKVLKVAPGQTYFTDGQTFGVQD